MIKPAENKIIELFFTSYIERILRKNFNNFIIVNEPPSVDSDKGLIITPNHFSWWDGFFVHFLNRKIFNRKFRLMMLEEQLSKHSYFRYLGAYSIDPGSLSGNKESLIYSAEESCKPNSIITIYPQGEIEELSSGKTNLKKGLYTILKLSASSCSVLPLAFKTEYGSNKYPALYCRFGNVLNSKDIVNSHDLFKNEFQINLQSLLNNSHTGKDLFKL